ncbi:MAG: T9SS type A sorting domain-containing protein, partial [Bacteroidia bacterium]|nr:T9SS type A sorting domain-containing protein [Bacteroidia bacterium]
LYSVTVTDANGCDALVYANVVFGGSAKSINDYEVFEYNLYPNPNNGTFTVNIVSPQSIDRVNMTLLNILGEEIKVETKSLKIDENRFEYDISDLHPGVYFLQIVSDGQKKTIRVVRQ